MEQQTLTRYPLLFTFRDKVEGNEFLAVITVHGRALAIQEDDGWWIHGVQPGGLAAGGHTFLEAYGEFRRDFTAILFDIAEEAKDFWAFKAGVQAFFDETDEVDEWKAAVEAVRAGNVKADGIPLPGDGIRKCPADSPRYIEVENKHRFKPNDNQFDSQPAVAA
jgi:hypothetical protein